MLVPSQRWTTRSVASPSPSRSTPRAIAGPPGHPVAGPAASGRRKTASPLATTTASAGQSWVGFDGATPVASSVSSTVSSTSPSPVRSSAQRHVSGQRALALLGQVADPGGSQVSPASSTLLLHEGVPGAYAKTSATPSVSLVTRLVASLVKATTLPSAEIAENPSKPFPPD